MTITDINHEHITSVVSKYCIFRYIILMANDSIIRLSGKNIGAFKEFEVEIPSITLIAGENSTGKSTITKSLYMLLNASRSIKTIIDNEIKNLEIRHTFLDTKHILSSFNPEEGKTDNKNSNDSSANIIVKELRQTEERLNILRKATTLDSLESEELKETIIKRLINAEFNNQMISNNSDNGQVSVSWNEVSSYIGMDGNKPTISLGAQDSDSSVVYFEASSFLETAITQNNEINHRKGTFNILSDAIQKVHSNNESIFAETDRNRMVNKFSDALHQIIGGRFGYDDKKSMYFYESEGIHYALENVASGIKAFSGIDLFINYGVIKENSIIILDEPETNLHPLWQVKLAELLISLVNETEMKILINSHSPYFIEALEIGCGKKLNKNNYRFYFSEIKDSTASVRDVTSDTDIIYNSLAAPYEILDRLWSKV